MTKSELKDVVLGYKDWEWWVERPFYPFLLSTWVQGQSKKGMAQFGISAPWPASLFQKGAFYKSVTVWKKFEKPLRGYISRGGSVTKIVRACELHHGQSVSRMKKLLTSKASTLEKLQEFYNIISPCASFIWIAHGFDFIYQRDLKKEVLRFIPAPEVDKYIGDIAYPRKHNAHYFFEQDLRSEMPIEMVQAKYAWIKSRDGFSAGFSRAELLKERRQIQKTPVAQFSRPRIPKQLASVVREVQALVYFRTLRTDVLYELFFMARPLLVEVCELYSIPFEELRYYTVQDLLRGKPIRYANTFTWATYGDDYAVFEAPIFKEKRLVKQLEVRGLIANSGAVRGPVKIVRTAHEIDKVKKGDILFAPTTTPSFILGMKRAAGFVTDEGGITSHAAIVSREMNKPCIIGTKVGTKMFTDGDMVELDATKGVVKKIS